MKIDNEIRDTYILSSRNGHVEDTVPEVCGKLIGKGNFVNIAGPCAVESEEQIFRIAGEVREAGADFFRGGAFKMRTSPYDFQGLGAEGIKLLVRAGAEFGLPVVSEIVDIRDLDIFADIDIIQVGERNMRNYPLLRELGRSGKPVLLKRGQSSTYEELLFSAEYILREGNKDVILCERGIRTFETNTRNTLDLAAVPELHILTHLPIIVDPSHGTGRSKLVEPMSLAAAAAGADGLIIEVHDNPSIAKSDANQAISPEIFAEIVDKVGRVRESIGMTAERKS